MTMTPSLDHPLADRRRMLAYIASRILEEGCRTVLADGPDGEFWVDLDPVRYGDGELDLHLDTNCPEWAGLSEAYEYLRREERMCWESGLDLAGWVRQRASKRVS